MTTLSASEIKGYAYNAGFRGNDLNIAVAIAFAESEGKTDAVNHNKNGSTDFGVWQINTVHPELLQSGSWSDPAANARMAYTLYKARRGFKDWASYNSGSYLAYLGKASITASSTIQTENPSVEIAQGNAVDVKGHQLVYGLVGGLMLLFALYNMSGSTAIGSAIKNAGKVAVLA